MPGEGGTINFRPDIYGRDKSLHEALFSQKAAPRTSTTAAAQP
jgi:murein L,D-transpeptidase YcbB/YkuD